MTLTINVLIYNEHYKDREQTLLYIMKNKAIVIFHMLISAAVPVVLRQDSVSLPRHRKPCMI